MHYFLSRNVSLRRNIGPRWRLYQDGLPLDKFKGNVRRQCLDANQEILFFPSSFRVRSLPTDASGETFVFQFPGKKKIFDIDWIGIISRRKKVR